MTAIHVTRVADSPIRLRVVRGPGQRLRAIARKWLCSLRSHGKTRQYGYPVDGGVAMRCASCYHQFGTTKTTVVWPANYNYPLTR